MWVGLCFFYLNFLIRTDCDLYIWQVRAKALMFFGIKKPATGGNFMLTDLRQKARSLTGISGLQGSYRLVRPQTTLLVYLAKCYE